ncbi:MAG TPA: hypothetical protein VJK03_01450 [Candidatus Nanoarchaeia archaeon]|nr:hypothetical protein [Candidatus Nanoarchaeia archaeon]
MAQISRPSLRMKKRYLLIEAPSEEAIERVLLEALGTLGVAAAMPLFVHPRKPLFGKYIVAVERAALTAVRAACELCPEKISILRVSGTLHGLGQ